MKKVIIILLTPIFVLVFTLADTIKADNMWDDPTYVQKEYTDLLGMPGFNDDIVKDHISLYESYVQDANDLLEQLNDMLLNNKLTTPEYFKTKQNYKLLFNKMSLHEYYFDNLGGISLINWDSRFYKKIEEEFGNFENWKTDFISAGSAQENGWVILCQDIKNGHLINVWIDEHDAGFLVDTTLILVMDVFKHAYSKDDNADRKTYIDSFFNNINWEVVTKRLK